MYLTQRTRSVGEYTRTHVQTDLHGASPHRLIQMLMEGFLTHVNVAKGAIEHGDIVQKSEQISRAIMIVGGLQEALNGEKGGELAANLADLYRYLRDRLLQASRDNDREALDEVSGLMVQIKSAWDAIPVELHHLTRQ